MRNRKQLVGLLLFAALLAKAAFASDDKSEQPVSPPKKSAGQIFAQDNLIAWCIVPFDSKKRGPIERVAMLRRLGFRHFAYDWRDEHLPTFDAEVAELQKNGIELTAVWFPALDAQGKQLLQVLKARGVKTQLWLTGGGEPTRTPEEQRLRIIAEAGRVRPIAEAAAAQGCSVALYNHGGWFGEPENQLAVIQELQLPNVKMVYNLHHGHAHLDRFEALLKKMQPHLVALNLNGMARDGDRQGRKILPLGAGDLDLELLKTIRDSGYGGPIGILGHTDDDAEERLRDNLDGLDWLRKQLQGDKAGAKPKYRTLPLQAVVPAASGLAPTSALVEGRFGSALDARVARAEVAGRSEYRDPPLTVDCWARLFDRQPFNIIVAHEPKSSGTHWELFSFAGTGKLTAYLPGMTPDHVHSEAVVTDGQWHHLAMIYEPDRLRLFVDAKLVADAAIVSRKMPPQAGGLAIGCLVTHEIGCAGLIDEVRLTRGVREIKTIPDAPCAADENTLALWRFDARQDGAVRGEGVLKQPAKLVAAQTRVASVAPEPPPGVQHVPGNQNLPGNQKIQIKLIDRSADDVFMAVKTDPQGQVFVGGREGVFVFVPREGGGFFPKRALYHFAQDSIIIGLEWRGDDLFVLTSSALYVLPRGRVEHEGLKPVRLLWGLPLDLHVSFHCLAWGPEGDLYLTHGDPLLQYGDWSRPDHWGHWTLHLEPGDRRVPFTGSGSVLRLKLSQTPAVTSATSAQASASSSWRVDELDVVATGLRGPVGLAFDRDWNLFTNDNDHESMADRYAPARLLHVTPHIDFGWPRGWMASKSPDRFDLIEPMDAELGRGVPCDLVYYDEPALADALPGRLLMARWDRHAVTAYPLLPRGASFETYESKVVEGQNNARPVGLGVGHDGRLFVTSLYLAGNVASPYCYSDLIVVESAADEAAQSVSTYNPVSLPDAGLWAELESPSWLRRGWAHQEILRRGGGLLDEATDRLARLLHGQPLEKKTTTKVVTSQDHLANHLLWLAAASRSPQALTLLAEAAKKREGPIYRQALRSLADLARQSAAGAGNTAKPAGATTIDVESLQPLFVAALSDADPRNRITALAFFHDTPADMPLQAVAAAGTSDDTYLRQTAVRLIAKRARPEDLEGLLTATDSATRLTGVLAAGLRLTVPPLHEPPPPNLPLALPAEGAFFKLKLPFADVSEPVSLTAAGRCGSYTMAQYWQTTARSKDLERLFDLLRLRLDDSDRRVRLQAAYFLSLLHDLRTEELVERTRLDVIVRDLEPTPAVAVDRAWLLGPFADGDQPGTKPHPPELGFIDLTARYGALIWTEIAAENHELPLPSAPQPSSAYVAFRVQSAARQNGSLQSNTRHVVAAWQNGRRLTPLPVSNSSDGPRWLLDLQPGGNDLLIRSRLDSSPQAFSLALHALKNVAVILPDKLDSNLLAERLRAAGQSDGVSVPREFIEVNWPEQVKLGNIDQGRRLFGTLGCVKCHAITADQKGGGAPSLTEARRRFTTLHLVESVLLPNKQVAEGFRSTTIVTAAGQVVTGLVVADDADRIELLLSDATRRPIDKAEIDERKLSELSPMPAGLVKTVAELQDLLAYLMSENPSPP